MKTKTIIAIVILVVAALGYWFMNSNSAVIVPPTENVAAVSVAVI